MDLGVFDEEGVLVRLVVTLLALVHRWWLVVSKDVRVTGVRLYDL